MPRLRSRVRASFPAPDSQENGHRPFSFFGVSDTQQRGEPPRIPTSGPYPWRKIRLPNFNGGVAEWSCSGLQSRVRRFDSDPRLQSLHATPLNEGGNWRPHPARMDESFAYGMVDDVSAGGCGLMGKVLAVDGRGQSASFIQQVLGDLRFDCSQQSVHPDEGGKGVGDDRSWNEDGQARLITGNGIDQPATSRNSSARWTARPRP